MTSEIMQSERHLEYRPGTGPIFAWSLTTAIHERGDSWISDCSAAWQELVQLGDRDSETSLCPAFDVGHASTEDEAAREHVRRREKSAGASQRAGQVMLR
jgi:hypothetical protein